MRPDPPPRELVPDPIMRREFGGVSEMTIWRWDHDQRLAALGWARPVVIRNKRYRFRDELEAFKANLVVATRAGAATTITPLRPHRKSRARTGGAV